MRQNSQTTLDVAAPNLSSRITTSENQQQVDFLTIISYGYLIDAKTAKAENLKTRRIPDIRPEQEESLINIFDTLIPDGLAKPSINQAKIENGKPHDKHLLKQRKAAQEILKKDMGEKHDQSLIFWSGEFFEEHQAEIILMSICEWTSVAADIITGDPAQIQPDCFGRPLPKTLEESSKPLFFPLPFFPKYLEETGNNRAYISIEESEAIMHFCNAYAENDQAKIHASFAKIIRLQCANEALFSIYHQTNQEDLTSCNIAGYLDFLENISSSTFFQNLPPDQKRYIEEHKIIFKFFTEQVGNKQFRIGNMVGYDKNTDSITGPTLMLIEQLPEPLRKLITPDPKNKSATPLKSTKEKYSSSPIKQRNTGTERLVPSGQKKPAINIPNTHATDFTARKLFAASSATSIEAEISYYSSCTSFDPNHFRSILDNTSFLEDDILEQTLRAAPESTKYFTPNHVDRNVISMRRQTSRRDFITSSLYKICVILEKYRLSEAEIVNFHDGFQHFRLSNFNPQNRDDKLSLLLSLIKKGNISADDQKIIWEYFGIAGFMLDYCYLLNNRANLFALEKAKNVHGLINKNIDLRIRENPQEETFLQELKHSLANNFFFKTNTIVGEFSNNFMERTGTYWHNAFIIITGLSRGGKTLPLHLRNNLYAFIKHCSTSPAILALTEISTQNLSAIFLDRKNTNETIINTIKRFSIPTTYVTDTELETELNQLRSFFQNKERFLEQYTTSRRDLKRHETDENRNRLTHYIHYVKETISTQFQEDTALFDAGELESLINEKTLYHAARLYMAACRAIQLNPKDNNISDIFEAIHTSQSRPDKSTQQTTLRKIDDQAAKMLEQGFTPMLTRAILDEKISSNLVEPKKKNQRTTVEQRKQQTVKGFAGHSNQDKAHEYARYLTTEPKKKNVEYGM